MIKTNELRVGNYIKFSGIGKATKIVPSDFHLQCRGIKGSEMPNVEPIEITEKHVTDFGFVSRKTDRKFDLDDFSVKVTKKGIAHFYFDNFDVAGFSYVHQLQNVYFALCGKELVFSSTEP